MATYSETIAGYRNALIDRAMDDPILMSNSNQYLEVSHSESIMAAIYGWKRLSKNRKFFRQGCSLHTTVVGRFGVPPTAVYKPFRHVV